MSYSKDHALRKQWTDILLHWINHCVDTSESTVALSGRTVVKILEKYKSDVWRGKKNIKPKNFHIFFKEHFPKLKLNYVEGDDRDAQRKLVVIVSVLLYYCCVHSSTGRVDDDICNKLPKEHQKVILVFCELLSKRDVTVHNVEKCMKEALVDTKPKQQPMERDFDAHELKKVYPIFEPSTYGLNFKSSVTVFPSSTIGNSSYAPSKNITSDEIDDESESDIYDPRHYGGDEHEIYHDDDPNRNEFIAVYDQSDPQCSSLCHSNVYTAATSHDKVPPCHPCTPLVLSQNPPKRPAENEYVTSKMSRDPQRTVNTCGPKLNEENKNLKPVGGCPSSCKITEGPRDVNKNGEPRLKSALKNSPTRAVRTNESHEMDKDVQEKKTKPNNDRNGNREPKKGSMSKNKKKKLTFLIVIGGVLALAAIVAGFLLLPQSESSTPTTKVKPPTRSNVYTYDRILRDNKNPVAEIWECWQGICVRNHNGVITGKSTETYPSYSRCVLQCTGAQIWPLPAGFTSYSKNIVGLTTRKLEYKLETIPSDTASQYLSQSFKSFLSDLINLENYNGEKFRDDTLQVKKLYIHVLIERDADPRMRVTTDETYNVKIETVDELTVAKVSSPSYVGVRHGLETLSQLILLDDHTGYLITDSNVNIKDSPSFSYRGLMLDTARNFIPLPDILRTLDAMATSKLNTLHWRVSDVASFSLNIEQLPKLTEYGAYDRSMIYSKQDVAVLVKRAAVQGIRVLIEVAAPGPVGRPWSWNPGATCPTSDTNDTCEDILCLRLNMAKSIFDHLQKIYTEIISMTKVDDVFHLSDGLFSLKNCYALVQDRQGFLSKALERLRIANNGLAPKLPLIWYTRHLKRISATRIWQKLGVQTSNWMLGRPSELAKYRTVHSTKWDLSCEVKKGRCIKFKTWQQMYNWKFWKGVEVYSVEGGEALGWTDFVNPESLDSFLWPRVAAVAERLWSDVAINSTGEASVYLRMNAIVTRLITKGIKAQPIWPKWCNSNLAQCLGTVYRT